MTRHKAELAHAVDLFVLKKRKHLTRFLGSFWFWRGLFFETFMSFSWWTHFSNNGTAAKACTKWYCAVHPVYSLYTVHKPVQLGGRILNDDPSLCVLHTLTLRWFLVLLTKPKPQYPVIIFRWKSSTLLVRFWILLRDIKKQWCVEIKHKCWKKVQ